MFKCDICDNVKFCNKSYADAQRLRRGQFCSISCSSKLTLNLEKTCLICDIKYVATNSSAKTCSNACYEIHKYNRVKLALEKRKILRVCRECGKNYKRIYEKSGFCSIRCGSKWNIKNGKFEKWRTHVNEKTGEFVKCKMCNNTIYATRCQLQQENLVLLCGIECKRLYFSQLFKGSKNPMYGKTMTDEQKEKQRNTLMKNHKVTNAFFLAKHRTISNAHNEIYNFLLDNFTELLIEKEKNVKIKEKRYFADILIENKINIEYFGDYWHCNPKYYSHDFFQNRKQAYAQEIWANDARRIENFTNNGYVVLTVWEDEFINNTANVLEQIVNFVKINIGEKVHEQI